MAKVLAHGDDRRWTVEAFDRWHAARPERWELLDGQPLMMAPATIRHRLIKSNAARHLGNGMANGACLVLVDGPAVKSRGLSAIPDIVVARSPVDPLKGEVEAPVVIVEIVSPSSERDDNHRKWLGYRLIPSLQHHLVIEQDGRLVTLRTRTSDVSWDEHLFEHGMIELPAIGASLSLDQIYENVTCAEFSAEMLAVEG